MRAILIDPFLQTVSEVENGGRLDDIRAAVFGDKLSERSAIEHYGVGADHAIYIDDEGLFVPWDEQKFFKLGGTMTIAGRALMLQDSPDGDTAPCLIPLETVKRTVSWIDAKDVRVPAPAVHSMDKDGNVTVELLHGVEEWHYGQQPGSRSGS